MPLSATTDGFRLAYDRHGEPGAPPVLLLHGWPGDRTDMTAVAERLTPAHDVVVPDLRGFGGSDSHDRDPAEQYSAAAQARSLGIRLTDLEETPELDLTVDGADEVGLVVGAGKRHAADRHHHGGAEALHSGKSDEVAMPASLLVPESLTHRSA